MIIKTPKLGPAVRQALEFLNGQVANAVDSAGARLPSLKELSENAGVSRSSMWKAARILREQGVLNFVHGGPIQLAGVASGNDSENGANQLYWEKKRSVFITDILDNRFADLDALPSISELQSMYGASYATVKKILDSLEASGMLVSNKRGYRVALPQYRRFQSTIVVVSITVDSPEFDVIAERAQALVSSLERECMRTGHIVKMAAINPGNKDIMARTIRSFHGDDSIAGYVLNVWWMGSRQWQVQYEEAIRLLATHRKPFAVLDHVGNFPITAMPTDAVVRLFRPANRHGGECAARLLLQKGHRQIAFLSAWHHMSWSIERLSGVERMAHMAGGSVELKIVAETAPFWDDAAILRAAGLTHAEFERIFLPGLSAAGVSAMRRLFESAQVAPNLPPERKAAITRACDDVRALAHMSHEKMSASAFAVIRGEFFRRIYYAIGESYADALFERALAYRGVTAWICSSDDTAFRAQTFLKAHGIGVPQDVAVIGFDNKLKSMEEQITSYDFNIGVVALHMMRYLFAPEKGSAGGRGSVDEIDGFLIERASTGLVRGPRSGQFADDRQAP
jgi:DNA-binding LacI/PurR family transcriptional regulator/biotin operon repressor